MTVKAVCLYTYIREICDLAEKYDAITLVDECHAAGILGQTGRFVTNCKATAVHVRNAFCVCTTCMSHVLVGELKSTWECKAEWIS